MKQLPLLFTDQPRYAEADFLAAASNAEARSWLARPDEWTAGRLVLWGEAGCGKSHLLHVWAATHGAAIVDGASLAALPPLAVAPFAGRPLAIDDADAAPDEAVLLHLINLAAAAGVPVLLAGRQPPGRRIFALADLASRLRASLAVAVRPPEDELLAALLAKWAAERQLMLGIAVQNYLLAHLPRTAGTLREAVARLDRAALEGQCRITRALAASLLRDLMMESGDVA